MASNDVANGTCELSDSDSRKLEVEIRQPKEDMDEKKGQMSREQLEKELYEIKQKLRKLMEGSREMYEFCRELNQQFLDLLQTLGIDPPSDEFINEHSGAYNDAFDGGEDQANGDETDGETSDDSSFVTQSDHKEEVEESM